jgi:hypothetical protein
MLFKAYNEYHLPVSLFLFNELLCSAALMLVQIGRVSGRSCVIRLVRQTNIYMMIYDKGGRQMYQNMH